MRRAGRLAAAIAALLWAAPGAAQPSPSAAGSFTPLREAREPELQAALDRAMEGDAFAALVKRKKLAVALAGISDPSCPRFAARNGEVMMYAASLPKIAILLAAFKRIEAGELELDRKTEKLLTDMIRKSSNTAATQAIELVGRQYIEELLQSPEYRLYDRDFGGGLWVGKVYGKRPAWRRDPLHHISHGASAVQVARFYYLLETGRLLRPDLTRRMKRILGDPGIQHKFVAGILSSFPGAEIFRKSGTWREYHSDSAIIERDGKRYIAVAMVESPEGEQVLRRLILELDGLIFRVPPHCPGEPATAPAGDGQPRAGGGCASPGSDARRPSSCAARST